MSSSKNQYGRCAALTLFDDFTNWRFEDSPEFATMVGKHHLDHKLESYTKMSYERRREIVTEFLLRSEELQSNLSSDDTRTREDLTLFSEMLQLYLDGYATKSFVFALASIEGVHVDLPQTISYMRFEVSEDFEKLASRLRSLPTQIDGIIEIMRFGISEGLTFHSVSMRQLTETLTALEEQDPLESPYYRPVLEAKVELSPTTSQSIVDAIKLAQKGFGTLRNFIRDEYMPVCRKDIGITSVAGAGYYNQCLKYHLGYAASAKDVHQLGLDEVDRIKIDIKKVISDLGLDLTPLQFAAKMRDDKTFVLNGQEEIKAYYERILKERIQPQLQSYFHSLPQAKLRLKLVDKSRAAGCLAYYIQGSADGTRPGTFYINGHDPQRSPTHLMPALALHEANPGHHLQTSHLLETKDLAKFRTLHEDRRYTDMPTHFPMHTAYTEGWGLYSEFLGHEMQVYRTPYELYGRYSREMFVACRLVVDTGMHAFGWTREKAIQFLTENTASAPGEIESEIDRYITWPGQACAYKIGEIRIRHLRMKAKKALGDKFDIRDFHEVVLNHSGSLDFLERAINNYIALHR